MNEKKTEVMAFNTQGSLNLRSGQVIKQVEEFKYLDLYLSNSAKDINVRIGCAWVAIRKLDSLWQSKLLVTKSLQDHVLQGNCRKYLSG